MWCWHRPSILLLWFWTTWYDRNFSLLGCWHHVCRYKEPPLHPYTPTKATHESTPCPLRACDGAWPIIMDTERNLTHCLFRINDSPSSKIIHFSHDHKKAKRPHYHYGIMGCQLGIFEYFSLNVCHWRLNSRTVPRLWSKEHCSRRSHDQQNVGQASFFPQKLPPHFQEDTCRDSKSGLKLWKWEWEQYFYIWYVTHSRRITYIQFRRCTNFIYGALTSFMVH